MIRAKKVIELKLCLLSQRVGGIPPKELIPLIEEARDMTLQPDSLPALEDALTKASTWQARAEKLLKNGELLSAMLFHVAEKHASLIMHLPISNLRSITCCLPAPSHLC